jgi:hypothetical protein
MYKAMETVGNYYYMLPVATQAKKIVWRGLDDNGERFLDKIPKNLIAINKKSKQLMINETEMLITLKNGSTIQLCGSDNYDRTIVGTNVRGIIFSEYALSDPNAWVYTRPILANNKGFAWFNSTPRGRNHFYKLILASMTNPLLKDDWYGAIRRNSETGVISEDEINLILAEGQMSEQQIAQEFECSFEGVLTGVIYEKQIIKAREKGRFGEFYHDPTLPVFISFDIGAGDRTAMTLIQQSGDTPKVIDFYSNKGMGIGHYVEIAKEYKYKYGYEYQTVFVPHDARKREMSNYDENGYALTMLDTFKRLFNGLAEVKLIPRCNDIIEDIEIVRANFHKWCFNTGNPKDEAQVSRLNYFYEAMNNYRFEEEGNLGKRISTKPLHNWASDPMDSFRYAVRSQCYGWTSPFSRYFLENIDNETKEEELELEEETINCYNNLI